MISLFFLVWDCFRCSLMMLRRLMLLTCRVVRNRKWDDVTNTAMTQRLWHFYSVYLNSLIVFQSRTCDIRTIWSGFPVSWSCIWCHCHRLRSEVRRVLCCPSEWSHDDVTDDVKHYQWVTIKDIFICSQLNVTIYSVNCNRPVKML